MTESDREDESVDARVHDALASCRIDRPGHRRPIVRPHLTSGSCRLRASEYVAPGPAPAQTYAPPVDAHDPALRKRLELPRKGDDEEAEDDAGGAGTHLLPRLSWLRPGETDPEVERPPARPPVTSDEAPPGEIGGSLGEDGARSLPSDDDDIAGRWRSEAGGDIFESAADPGEEWPLDTEDPGLPD